MATNNFATIFVSILLTIPTVRADLMTYFLNHTHLPINSSFQQNLYADQESQLSELAINPLISLPGTQDEFENPFNKLFEHQTQQLLKHKSKILGDSINDKVMNFLLKLFNPISDYSNCSINYEINDYLFEPISPMYKVFNQGIEDDLANGNLLTKKEDLNTFSENYFENQYLHQRILNYLTGDRFVEALYGNLNTQFVVPMHYIAKISQKYAPSMLKLQLPINKIAQNAPENKDEAIPESYNNAFLNAQPIVNEKPYKSELNTVPLQNTSASSDEKFDTSINYLL